MWLRAILVAAAAIGGGVALGRRAAGKVIEQRLPAEIEAAKALAVAELDKEIGEFIRERLTSFLWSISLKLSLVCAFYLLYAYEHLTATGLKIVVTAMLAIFLIRDAAKTLPYVTPTLRHVRRHGWNLANALKEVVAGVAFERAYARALLAVETGANRHWIAFSNYSAHAISVEVAEAVADVARATSLHRARWRAATAATTATLTFAAYAFLLMAALAAGDGTGAL